MIIKFGTGIVQIRPRDSFSNILSFEEMINCEDCKLSFVHIPYNTIRAEEWEGYIKNNTLMSLDELQKNNMYIVWLSFKNGIDDCLSVVTISV